MNEQAPLENSVALVTGASGFIGGHLVDFLLERGCKVHCLVRKTADLKWLDTSKVHLHTADLAQPNAALPCLEETEYVFHCAGLTRAKTRAEFFKINADACTPFYENCAASGKRIKAVVHLSSQAAVGPASLYQPVDESTPCNPLTHYGKSKRAGEEIAERFASSLPMVILRPPVVYGPREKNFFSYLKTLSSGWNIKIGTVRRELSLIYVQDLVRAMVEAACRLPLGENVFCVTDGNIYSWDDVAQTAQRILKVRARTLVIPETVLAIAGSLMEGLARFSKTPALIDRQRVIDIRQQSWTADPKKFFDRAHFQPRYDLEKGLQETFKWYKENHWL